MSFNYDKHVGEDCWDHVMEEECCDHEPVVAYVNGNLGTIAGGPLPANTPTRIPLTAILFRTPGVEIPPDGGVTVLEDGEYFISFNAQYSSSVAGATASFSIYTPKLIGTATSPLGPGAVTFSTLARLRRGDTVYVTVTASAPLTNVGSLLRVAKIPK
ncbi:TNF domain-containing protein [Priestia megaterium]